jgi:DNA polymerase III epsilon subunit-like protein
MVEGSSGYPLKESMSPATSGVESPLESVKTAEPAVTWYVIVANLSGEVQATACVDSATEPTEVGTSFLQSASLFRAVTTGFSTLVRSWMVSPIFMRGCLEFNKRMGTFVISYQCYPAIPYYMEKYFIFDIETNALEIQSVTKIHCLSFVHLNGEDKTVRTVTKPEQIQRFFQQEGAVFIGHNIWDYDIQVAEAMFGMQFAWKKNRVIDTLGLSWYLFPHREKHGLESWGKDLGIHKVEVTDWEEGSLELYQHRCEEDVRITHALLLHCQRKLTDLYGVNNYRHVIDYLSFKQFCYYLSAKNPFRLDVERVEAGVEELEQLLEVATTELAGVMPKVKVFTTRKRPKIMFKKDGSLSAAGVAWQKLVADCKEDESVEQIKYVSAEEEPNPGSSAQVKDWLMSLGWKPTVFKDGKNGKVPQIRIEDGDNGKVLAPCVRKLVAKHPSLVHLEKTTLLVHRLGLLKGFLKDVSEDGHITAGIAGLTNTLRVKHRTLVNLPGVSKPYGALIRGCLLAPDGYELVGSDVSGLEDTTKRHYIYPFDPDYVREQMRPGFDPHLDIAVQANLMNAEDVVFYKAFGAVSAAIGLGQEPNSEDMDVLRNFRVPEEEQKDYAKKLGSGRKKAKTVNFSATYGVGAKKLADTLDIKVREAEIILEAYWKRNHAILKFVKTLKVKTVQQNITEKYDYWVEELVEEQVDGETILVPKRVLKKGERSIPTKEEWVLNPVSKIWYRLRSEKDKFSTINQSTGAFLFDQWVKEIVWKYPHLLGQFHDEVAMRSPVDADQKVMLKVFLKQCMEKVNERYRLNTPLGIDVQFGPNYAEIH